MSENYYRSQYTGAEIDAAIEKVRSMAWNSQVILSTSGVKGGDSHSGIAFNVLAQYPLLVFTGYKEGVAEAACQTTSIVVSTKAIWDRDGSSGGQYTLNLPLSVRDGNYSTWETTLFFWVSSGNLHWLTAENYSGSQEFVVTRVEGFKI